MRFKFLIISILFVASSFASSLTIVVGSTFDYPPLTYYKNDKPDGYDINIIESFAQANNYSIKFIKTSWPTLNQDLSNKKFNIAVGGITKNPQRKQLFLFSSPIIQSKKAALILCTNLTKYNNIDIINNKSTRVVENKGGTNETFAKSIVPNATITIESNNQTPFQMILDNKADVMFTDDIEIEYKRKLNPKFCMANLEIDSPISNKIFLFNNDGFGQKLQTQFNTWWAKNKPDKTQRN